MNGIYRKYLWSELRSNRKRLFSEITVYIVFAVLMSLIVTVFTSFSLSYDDYIEKKFGLYDGFAVNVSDKKLAEASSNTAIGDYGEININGYIESVSDGSDPVTMGVVSDAALKMLNLSLVSGRMPENNREIILEQSIADRLSDRFSSDGEISLRVFDFAGGTHEMTFTVVGVVSDYVYNHSKLVRDFETKSLPDEQLPGIIMKKSEMPAVRLLLVDVARGESKTETLASLSGKYFLNHGRINRLSDSVYEFITSVTVLVFITGILFLYGNLILRRNVYAMRTRRLKLCGLTNRNVFLYRAASLTIPVVASSILGTLVGILLSWIIVSWMRGLVDFISFHASVMWYFVIAAADAVLVIVLSLIYEAVLISKRPLLISVNRDEKNVMNLSSSFFKKHPLFGWSLKSHSYYSKKHAAVFLCAVLVGLAVNFGGSMLVDTMNDIESNVPSYDYRLYPNTFVSSIDVIGMPIGSTAVIDKKDVGMLLSSDEVKDVVAFSGSAVHIIDEKLGDINPFPLLEPDTYTSKEMLCDILRNFGYGEDETLYRASIMYCNDEFISELLKLSGSEESALEKGEGILCIDGESPYSAGDTVKLTQPMHTTNKRVDAEMKIKAVVDYELVDDSYRSKNTFYICDPDFPLLPDGGKYKAVNIVLRDKTEYEETERMISQLNALYSGSLRVVSIRESNAETQAVKASTSILCFLIIAVFSIYCMINVCGMVSEKLYANRTSWSLLRIHGVGKHTALGMLFIETAVTLFCGMAVSTTLFYGLIICCGDINRVITPIASVFALIILLVVCLACVWKTVHNFWKMSVLHMTRNVN